MLSASKKLIDDEPELISSHFFRVFVFRPLLLSCTQNSLSKPTVDFNFTAPTLTNLSIIWCEIVCTQILRISMNDCFNSGVKNDIFFCGFTIEFQSFQINSTLYPFQQSPRALNACARFFEAFKLAQLSTPTERAGWKSPNFFFHLFANSQQRLLNIFLIFSSAQHLFMLLSACLLSLWSQHRKRVW